MRPDLKKLVSIFFFSFFLCAKPFWVLDIHSVPIRNAQERDFWTHLLKDFEYIRQDLSPSLSTSRVGDVVLVDSLVYLCW